jgi:hypothetical protein
MSSKKTDNFNPNLLYESLMRASNAGGKQHFSNDYEEVKVNINPDKNVSLGNFKPDLLNPGHYKAHPTTIAAMRKDLFTAGSDEFLDLEKPYICEGCKRTLDMQFWQFCPYCETHFSNDS